MAVNDNNDAELKAFSAYEKSLIEKRTGLLPEETKGKNDEIFFFLFFEDGPEFPIKMNYAAFQAELQRLDDFCATHNATLDDLLPVALEQLYFSQPEKALPSLLVLAIIALFQKSWTALHPTGVEAQTFYRLSRASFIVDRRDVDDYLTSCLFS